MMSNWKKGTQLNNGQYIIESMLLKATGSLAYKAMDKKNGKLVTIKTMTQANYTQSNQEISQEQTKQIIKIANCHHPNLVKLDPQILKDQDQYYIVMEYIEGEDLASYLDHNGKFTHKEALKIIAKIGSALNILHQNGFIHQDIKPQNIILRTDNLEPVLNDFGLAIDLLSFRQKKVNTNLMDSFSPPEIYRNQNDIGIHTDIYSLAATLYVLLTVQLPSPPNARQYNPLIPPQALNPEITDGLNQAILKAMELDYSSRPKTLKEWFKLLQSSVPSSSNSTVNKQNNQLEQIKNSNGQNILTPESTPNIKSFDFETITVDIQPQLFGLVSRINKNSISKKSKYFQEKLDENVSIEMIYIPNGSFIMGSTNNELGREKDESPQQKIRIKSFYMSKFPITQAQWRIVATFPQINRNLNPNPSCFKGDKLPVEKVSWYDATEFCQRLSKYTNRTYLLPTEAQWEYACRGGTTTPFYFGEMITTDLANYDGRQGYGTKPTGKYDKKTSPVDSFTPNPFGLYDLHGNVWEWCEDHYSPSYKSKSTDGTAYYSNMMSSPRLVRGGSWSLNPTYCRSGKRSSYAPDSNYNFLGFRIICTLN